MKFPALKFVFALFLSILSTTSIAATLVNRVDFGANAVEFGFDNANVDDLNPGDDNFQVNGGVVRESPFIDFSTPGLTPPNAYFGPGNQLNFSFNDPVSAFGFNFSFSNLDPYLFFLADSNGNSIGFANLNPANFDVCPNISFFVCGFIGLNVDANQISSAGFIKQGGSNFGPIIDNVIYETVPTPGILWLFSTGFLGLYWSRKHNFS